MKNRTKRNKIKENSKMKQPSYPNYWLYLNENEVTLLQIKETLQALYSVEYWQEAGVLEAEIPELSSVDFEEVDMKRADEATASYLKEQKIETVFVVTIVPEDFEWAKKVMEVVITHTGGYFCGDTPDFTPQVK